MIGPKTLKQIKDEFGGLLDNYAKQIGDAYLANDMELDVRLSAKLRGAGGSNTAIKAEIAFIESRVKDSAEAFVDENQRELFEGGKKYDKANPPRLPSVDHARTSGRSQPHPGGHPARTGNNTDRRATESDSRNQQPIDVGGDKNK